MTYLQAIKQLLAKTVIPGLPAGYKVTAADVVFVLGLLFALKLALGFISDLIGAAMQPAKRKITSYGKWAVVTGATDGIGKAYAMELAKKGLDVVIIARSADKLKATSEEIASKTNRKVATIVADFSKPDGGALYEHIDKQLKAITGADGVGILVNNVGVSYPSALFFHELEKYAPNRTQELIDINIVALTKMTQLVLPGMLEKKRGAIVNLSSAAGRIPIGNPLFAVYSGTKAYVDFFSRSLNREYAAKGIHVQCQFPYFVATAMSKIRHASLTTPSPAGFAKAGVASIGGGDSVLPFWAHGVQDWFIQNTPKWLLTRLITGMHIGLRAKYFKKLDREAAAAGNFNGVTGGDAAATVPASEGTRRRGRQA